MPGSSTPKELLGTSTGSSGDQELGTEAEVDLGGWEGEDWAPRQLPHPGQQHLQPDLVRVADCDRDLPTHASECPDETEREGVGGVPHSGVGAEESRRNCSEEQRAKAGSG